MNRRSPRKGFEMLVLLVEDDPSIAGALSEGLPRYGFGVEHVWTGAEALAAYGEADLVLLDLGLPDADGIGRCAVPYVYEKIDGRWLIVEHHSSAVPA
jgi:DNA-binding NtrC family response regulator